MGNVVRNGGTRACGKGGLMKVGPILFGVITTCVFSPAAGVQRMKCSV